MRYRECFEIRRWASTLVAMHLLRYGMDPALNRTAHDIWWDVGNAARRSRRDPNKPIANPESNWAAWMYLGWIFDPSRRSSFYTGEGLRRLGYNRHATFVALRSQVARPLNSPTVYQDLVHAVRFAPREWTASVARFGLQHLTERVGRGDNPKTAEQRASAAASIRQALVDAQRNVSAADYAALEALAQPVLAALAAG